MKYVNTISIAELQTMAENMYGNFVKADVDVTRKTVIVDMEMHADGEAELLAAGSKQEDLWGVNLYPAKFGTPEFIEFDSMINLKPRQQNMTRGIEDPAVQVRIRDIVGGVVHE